MQRTASERVTDGVGAGAGPDRSAAMETRGRKHSQQMPASRLESVAHFCHSQHLLFYWRMRKGERDREERWRKWESWKKCKKFICWYFCCVQLLLERRCRRCRCHRCQLVARFQYLIILRIRPECVWVWHPVRSLHLQRVRVGAIINSYIMNEQIDKQTNRQTDKQTDDQTDRQTNRITCRETDISAYLDKRTELCA